MMKRVKDWRAQLHAIVDERTRQAHSYGTQDCAVFCADCIRAMTDVDVMAPYRGQYKSAREAIEILKQFDGDLLRYITDSGLLPEIDPVRARMGDLAAIRDDSMVGGWALGIVGGPRVFVLREDGVGTVSLSDIDRAFSV